MFRKRSLLVDDIMAAATLNRTALRFLLTELLEDDEVVESWEHQNSSEELLALCAISNNTPAIRIQSYAEEVVPDYSAGVFKSHFRMLPSTFEILTQMIGNCSVMQELFGHGGRPVIEARKQVLISLWTLGNREAFRSVADRFNVTKSSVSRVLERITDCLVDLGKQVIFWPNRTECADISEEFRRRCGLPGVVGAVDGCHIPIKAPREHQSSYINRKHFHSVILQGTCDHQLLFRDVCAGWPGSVHDAKVLRNSDLHRETTERLQDFFPDDKHLLGDSAYPLERWLLTPYRDNGHLSRGQTVFNSHHAVGRQVIERAFGLLKGRFRRLKYLDTNSVKKIPSIIVSCCILHNICHSAGDVVQIQDETNDEVNNFINVTPNPEQAVQKRDRIMTSLH